MSVIQFLHHLCFYTETLNTLEVPFFLMWRDKGFQVLLIHPSDYFRIAGISCHLRIYTHLSQWAILDGGDNRAEVK